MKNHFIEAYCWLFGGTRKEAEKRFKLADASYRAAVIEAYEDQCRKAYFND